MGVVCQRAATPRLDRVVGHQDPARRAGPGSRIPHALSCAGKRKAPRPRSATPRSPPASTRARRGSHPRTTCSIREARSPTGAGALPGDGVIRPRGRSARAGQWPAARDLPREVEIGIQICAGLESAHTAGIIHTGISRVGQHPLDDRRPHQDRGLRSGTHGEPPAHRRAVRCRRASAPRAPGGCWARCTAWLPSRRAGRTTDARSDLVLAGSDSLTSWSPGGSRSPAIPTTW